MTPWTVARQASLTMGLSRQEYWNRLPLPSPGNLPYSGMESESLSSPALAGGFTTEPPGKAPVIIQSVIILTLELRKLRYEGVW